MTSYDSRDPGLLVCCQVQPVQVNAPVEIRAVRGWFPPRFPQTGVFGEAESWQPLCHMEPGARIELATS